MGFLLHKTEEGAWKFTILTHGTSLTNQGVFYETGYQLLPLPGNPK